ncbi:MAG: GNAT family N-acetyltransferase [Tepidisphaeraceae bacterium]
MRVREHTDPSGFNRQILPLLLEHECENCIQLGILGRLVEGKSQPAPGDGPPLLLSVDDGDKPVSAAIQTRPHAILVSRCEPEAADALLNELARRKWNGLGVVAPVPTIDDLERRWSQWSGRPARLFRALRAFQTTRVIEPPALPGALRQAVESDIPLVTKWFAGFARDINEPADDRPDIARRGIDESRVYLWVDDQPRAMIAWAGPTPNGIRVNQVYTPPEFRGRGYATSATAALTRQLLATRRFCFLFTDLANPTSNAIYQRIGYEPVADLRHVSFDHGAAE